MAQHDAFAEQRSLLFTIAYEILGSATDAEDVLQETYLRWRDVDTAVVDHPRSYLAQIVTRQALNHLRTVKRRRETYVGTWLPEPIRTEPEVGSDDVLSENLSVAMLVVLESLSPDQRAVFVLREVFGFASAEVATMVDKSDASVRQLARRARQHVQERRPRFEAAPSAVDHLVTRFVSAAQGGDLQGLMDVLAPDVVQISDGGGQVAAARHPILGIDKVAAFVVGIATGPASGARFEFTACNAMPAVLLWNEDRLDSALLFTIANDHISQVFAIRNPDKLRSLARPVGVAR